jgi:hypothetical protein
VLAVLPLGKTMTGNLPMATIMDHKPMINVPTFGMCSSLSNPVVIAATAASLGVLTPMPCVPLTTAPWAPGSPTVMVANTPALNNSSKLMCNWGGVISITMPGCMTVQIP